MYVPGIPDLQTCAINQGTAVQYAYILFPVKSIQIQQNCKISKSVAKLKIRQYMFIVMIAAVTVYQLKSYNLDQELSMFSGRGLEWPSFGCRREGIRTKMSLLLLPASHHGTIAEVLFLQNPCHPTMVWHGLSFRSAEAWGASVRHRAGTGPFCWSPRPMIAV